MSRAAIKEMPEHERPLSERYRIAANAWVQADHEARFQEEIKTSRFETMKTRLLAEATEPMAENKLERIVKSSDEWRDFILNMVTKRTTANRLKIDIVEIQMLEREQQDRNQTIRAEMRLSGR